MIVDIKIKMINVLIICSWRRVWFHLKSDDLSDLKSCTSYLVPVGLDSEVGYYQDILRHKVSVDDKCDLDVTLCFSTVHKALFVVFQGDPPTNAKEPILPCYLSTAGRKGFRFFPLKALVQMKVSFLEYTIY